ncbi:MAG: hypothetical protein IKJ33_03080 [Clostridia bacterium]|nr:hypothetical protein [Clostridia bacterium]
MSHSFNFKGGHLLSNMGASWFVSFCYYENVDKNHINWAFISTVDNRMSTFKRSLKYHRFWLEQILEMNDKNLEKNTIDLTAEQIKCMAMELIEKCQNAKN